MRTTARKHAHAITPARPESPCQRVGLACCGDRLASLWDTAECVEIHSRKGPAWRYEGASTLYGLGLNGRIDVLRKARVHVLVCGAMSGCTRNSVEACGILVHPWISGSREEVLAALSENRLAGLLMPGCGGRGRCQERCQERSRMSGKRGELQT